VLGFVPADAIRPKKDLWFTKLSNEQITLVEKFLETKRSPPKNSGFFD